MTRLIAALAGFALIAAACATRVDDEAWRTGLQGSAEGPIQPADGRSDSDVDGTAPSVGQGPDGVGSPPGAMTPEGQGAAADGDPGAAEASGDVPGDQAGGGDQTAPARASNTASDVGVTPTTIKIGNIVSRGGTLGPHQMTPSYYGANAYFQLLNARGGVNGRTIEFVTCDDREEAGGNIRCAQRLVEQEQVFAFAASTSYVFAGARYISEQGVPDVGGQPIGNEYFTYPNLYALTGAPYDRDGRPGNNGTLYWPTAPAHWFTQNVGVTKGAVFYYSAAAISQQIGELMAESLEDAGVETVMYDINPALPNFDSRVADMQRRGVDTIWDALDINANQNLCRAMERRGFTVPAKVSTVSVWSQSVGTDFSAGCRGSLYVGGTSQPASDARDPRIAEFQDTMRRVYGDRFDGRLHQWHFEGWLAAALLVDGIERLGPGVTRAGLIRWLDGLTDYTWDGLGAPRQWHSHDWNNPPRQSCFTIARWDDAAGDFIPVADVDTCLPTTWLAYRAM